MARNCKQCGFQIPESRERNAMPLNCTNPHHAAGHVTCPTCGRTEGHIRGSLGKTSGLVRCAAGHTWQAYPDTE